MNDSNSADSSSIAATIRKSHVDRAEAYRRGDVDGYLSYYTSDARMFIQDRMMTLQELAQVVRSQFDQGARVLDLKVTSDVDLQISDTGDAAVASFSWWESFQNPDGSVSNSSFHETDIWFRSSGRWKVVNFHFTAIGA